MVEWKMVVCIYKNFVWALFSTFPFYFSTFLLLRRRIEKKPLYQVEWPFYLRREGFLIIQGSLTIIIDNVGYLEDHPPGIYQLF